MKWVTFNGITRSILGQKRLPIHYYSRFLKFVSDGYRELRFDTLQIVNTQRISINENGAAQIPNDCIGVILVGVQVGQYVRPMIEKKSINRLPNYDTSTGLVTTYGLPSNTYDRDWGAGLMWTGIHYNDNGENTGGYYGLGTGYETDVYNIIEERDEIQFDETYANSTAVVIYLGDGSFSNPASRVTPLSQKAIESYADWQYKLHSKSFGLGDSQQAKDEFDSQNRRLRARKNNLTPELLVRIINRASKASIKQ